MYTGVLDQNLMINFFRSIGYSIGSISKMYEDKQVTIKIVLADIINPQDRPIDALISALHELHLRKTFEMVDTRSNMQLHDLYSNHHGGKTS